MPGGLRLLIPWPLRRLKSSIKSGVPATTQPPHLQEIHIPSRPISRTRCDALHKGTRIITRSAHFESSSELVNHLNSTFSPLRFPPELATHLLTHASHPDSKFHGHNARLAFTGRRVLESYFLLFLHSCPDISPTDDYEQLASRTLNTYLLGEHVAPKWSIGKVLRWRPAVDIQASSKSKSVGLHKVQGTTVEAIVGGIYHQFGGSVAHKIFHTRVFPHLLLRGTSQGLQDSYHHYALQIFQRMGGEQDRIHL